MVSSAEVKRLDPGSNASFCCLPEERLRGGSGGFVRWMVQTSELPREPSLVGVAGDGERLGRPTDHGESGAVERRKEGVCSEAVGAGVENEARARVSRVEGRAAPQALGGSVALRLRSLPPKRPRSSERKAA